MVVLLSKFVSSYHSVLTLVSLSSFDGLRGLAKTQSSLLPLVEGRKPPASVTMTVFIDGEDEVTGENVAEDVEDRGRVPVDDGYSGARSPALGRGGGGTCRFSSFL